MNTNAIFSIFAYSVKRMTEKYIDEKSVRNPATNSDSASGKSKGTRFDSANNDINDTNNNKIK